ncbi:MAG: FAD-dependent oxidoreductase [Pseudomonadota bacterium]
MKIAVLGGGSVGCAAAIELASNGHDVDLFEAREDILLGASRVNEGKIHQGFIYAKDDPELTARTMAQGAVSFRHILSRWVDADAAIQLSTPFLYARHVASQVTSEHLSAHFARCSEIFNEVREATGLDYLGSDAPAGFVEMAPEDGSGRVNPDQITTLYRTTERGVDPRVVSDALAAATGAEPRITRRCATRVMAVSRRALQGFDVSLKDGAADGPYDQVINATWEGRTAIDASMGIAPPKSYSLRHKYGHRVQVPLAAGDLPSLTTVLGPFGDIVNFGAQGFYLSWYPSGMTFMTASNGVDQGWHRIDRAERMANFRSSLEVWTVLCPLLGDLEYGDEDVDPTSGLIYALGDTDIDDLDSQLHTRHAVGMASHDGYHTVNTGKYTLFPQMALAVAGRVLGRV